MYRRSYALSWNVVADENRRFNKILLWSLGVTLLLGMVLPVLPLRDKSTLAPPQLPPRMAKLLLAPKAKPPEPVVELPPEPVKPVEQNVQVPEQAPAPKPATVAETVTPEPAPPARATARERASKVGVMAFADQLTDLRQAVPGESLRSGTRVAATGDGLAQRKLVTAANGRASAGINTSGMSRATGGGGLADRQTTRVTTQSPSVPARASSAGRSGNESGTGGRSREEIEKVFDRNKAAIYALYRRALRTDPSLEGKVVLTLTIAPSGDVTDVRIVSSELSAPELENKLLRRIRMFDFGARDVAVTTTTKPIDFFPA